MKSTIRIALLAAALALVPALASAATLYITEFGGYQPNGLPAAFAPEVTHQTVTVSGSSTQSSAFNASTQLVRLFADAAMCVQIGGASPTATSSSLPMAANQVEYFLVRAGDKLAAITCTP
jgi:hypothetical protein